MIRALVCADTEFELCYLGSVEKVRLLKKSFCIFPLLSPAIQSSLICFILRGVLLIVLIFSPVFCLTFILSVYLSVEYYLKAGLCKFSE